MKKVLPLILVSIGLMIVIYGQREDVANGSPIMTTGFVVFGIGLVWFIVSRIQAGRKK